MVQIESIIKYAKLDKETKILLYTSTEFMSHIKIHKLYDKNIFDFEIDDAINNLDMACKSRLNLFDLKKSDNFDKFLYLDTDIIIKDEINKVFDLCVDDKLYCLQEGVINDIYHGKGLFESEPEDSYKDLSAFTSGILLFNHCAPIIDLFKTIKKDIIDRPGNSLCFDQPYIIYNAFKLKLYENQTLKSVAVNNDEDVDSDKVIHHFPGLTGKYCIKMNKMERFMINMRVKNCNDKLNYVI
jgi:lipopolysaccharide biosynthesis glycosyltransferase